jgi:hypothetical protein
MKRNWNSFIVFRGILVLLGFIPFASAQDIYVSNNCKGISLCYSNLPEAISYANANDKIFIKSGEYFVDPIKIEKNIIIEGENRENTILYPSTETSCCTGDSQAWFLISEKVVFDIHGLTFDGRGKKISQAIRSFGNGNIYNNIFRNISWSDNQGAAIVAFGGDTVIDSNSFSGIGRNAIWAGSYYIEESFRVNIPIAGDNYQITNNILEGKGECDCIDKGIEVGVKTSNTKISGNEIFNYKGRYSAERSYSKGILVWNLLGEPLGIEIYENVIHDCVIPIYLKNEGESGSQIKVSENNMYENEYDGLNTNYHQEKVIRFEGIDSENRPLDESEENSTFSPIPDYLFDIRLDILDKTLKRQEPLDTSLRFENFGTKPTPTHINYIILDGYNQEVYSETEEIVVETEQTITKRFENLVLSGGQYTLYVKVDYSDVTENFKQDFIVEGASDNIGINSFTFSSGNINYIWVIIGVLTMWISITFYREYKKNLKEKDNRQKNVKRKR